VYVCVAIQYKFPIGDLRIRCPTHTLNIGYARVVRSGNRIFEK